jgi:hypothetical protein
VLLWWVVPESLWRAWTVVENFQGQIFVLSLGGAVDGLASDALAGMQGLELPRGSLSAPLEACTLHAARAPLVQHPR